MRELIETLQAFEVVRIEFNQQRQGDPIDNIKNDIQDTSDQVNEMVKTLDNQ